MTVAEAVFRGLSYAGLVLVLGVAAYARFLVPSGVDGRVATRFIRLGLAVVAITAVGEFVAVMIDAGTGPLATTASRSGTALVLRLALTALLAAWAGQRADAPGEPPPAAVPAAAAPVVANSEASAASGFGGILGGGRDWVDAEDGPRAETTPAPRRRDVTGGVLLLLFAATWVLDDRAAVGNYPAVKVPLALIHLVAMALWLGGLLAVAAAARPDGDGTRLLDLLPRLSMVSAAALVVLVVSGAGLAVAEAGGSWPDTDTAFGSLAVAKVAIIVVAAIGAIVARAYVNRHLGDLAVAVRAPVSVVAAVVAGELLLGAVALGVSAALTVAAY